ncbi:MAG: NAD(P)H-dependent oxidoreductase [Eubacteriaceae bacterium]|nr:NAD(P)H-dependent oxidoreductase [Eubacteriaceae bacterium]
MSNVFIVYAHPSEDSFTRHVRESFIKGLQASGHSYVLSDWYKMGFQTDISEKEYLREANYNIEAPLPDEVLIEQGKINSSDAIAFIYPVFWTEAPAKLVGWFDRVWNPPGKPNKGTLLLDATCAAADIAFPQDINILNEARLIHLSMEGGYSRLEKFSFDAFNESTGLIGVVEGFRSRNGHYPERVLADKIFRNRANLEYCSKRGIRLPEPRLSRPQASGEVKKEQKRIERTSMCDRNEVEGVFGTGKTSYGLERVPARLEVTTMDSAGMSLVVMNLWKALGKLLNAPVPEPG